MKGTVVMGAWLALASGCRDEPVARGELVSTALAAEYAGCAAVRTGPVCEVIPPAELTVWVPGVGHLDPGPPAVFSFENKPLAVAEPTEVGGGRRYRVPLAGPGVLRAEVQGALPARWQLSIAQHTAVPVLALADGLRRQDPPAAGARLREALPTLQGTDHALAELLLGKVERQLGQLDAALAHLRSAEATLRAAGHLSGATNAAEVMAFVLSEVQYRFADAEDVLAAYPIEGAAYPEGAARIPLYRAYPAVATGDYRQGLRALDDAEARTERLDLKDLLASVRLQRAGVLRQFGRAEDAAVAAEAAALAFSEAQVCPRAMALNNVAVARASVPREGMRGPTWQAVLAPAQQAVDLGKQCGDAEQAVLFQLTLAEIAIQFREMAVAEAALASVGVVPDGRLAMWAGLLRGQVELGAGRLEAARLAFHDAAVRSQGSGHRSLEYLARIGEARAVGGLSPSLRPAGDRSVDALALFAAADRMVDEVLLRVPVGPEREAFIGHQDEGVQAHIELLLALRRTAEALEISRRSRMRSMASLRLADRLDGLDAPTRRRWQEAVGAYLQLKAELETDDWSLTEEARARKVAAASGNAERLQKLLDAAWDAVGARPDDPVLPPLQAGELLLHYRPGTEGWWAFSLDDQGVRAESIAAPSADLTPEALAQLLYGPFEASIQRARRVRLLVPGALAARDLHALPFRGRPLAAARSVVYALDLPPLARPPRVGVLVVADPRGDLAGARATGGVLAAGANRRLLTGDAARRSAVLEALGKADLLYYSGHGDFGGDGWGSHLRLAGADLLTSGDILVHGGVPRQVVLAGCDTALSARRTVAPGMSLAHAFAVAGAEVVIATSRPVGDLESARFVEALDQAFRPQGDLVEAFHEAARSQADLDWAAWRVVVR